MGTKAGAARVACLCEWTSNAESGRVTPAGFLHLPGRLDGPSQKALADKVLEATETAPFYRPITPGGRPMSVLMTNFGPLGWMTDAAGYRYLPEHPVTGAPWPPIPALLLELWSLLADPVTPPDACLVNLYRGDARMGLHQDRDEADFDYPVLSVSLGDTATFRLGGSSRSGPITSLKLISGDVCVMGGEARLAYHGVHRIVAGSSGLIPGGGRVNLTLRRARPSPSRGR